MNIMYTCTTSTSSTTTNGMIEGDTVDNHELAKVILVRVVVTMPGDDVVRRVVLTGEGVGCGGGVNVGGVMTVKFTLVTINMG